ncbi:MAG: diguanylate cyclase [Desulfovibrionaceae bacterium]|nr:diguanylate cyclase [Desulfovibrionaceae bacterium]
MSDTQKVLAVDDSKTNLALLKHMLAGVGCEVVTAESGPEAIRLAGEYDFALILLDIQMPGMDGYEAASRIKEIERGRHVPIIFITAFFQDDDNVRQGYDTGAVDYLFRPVDAHVLICKVKAFLEMHRQKILLEREIEMHRRTEAALSKAEEKYRSIFERAVEGIYQITPAGEFLEVNPAMLRILGYKTPSDIIGRPGMWASVMADNDERQAYEEIMRRDGAVTNFEFHGRRRDGEVLWCSMNSRMVRQAGGADFIEGVLEDITERKNIELELKELAMVDSLTGIANRHRFFDRLDHALAVAKRYEKILAVLFIDLDEFKRINDTFGHPAGDGLLREVAERLQARTRASDTLARIGGDEFGLLLTDVPGRDGAVAVTKGLLDVLKKPFAIKGEEVTVSATIGISFYPDDGLDPVTLISRADAAMYGAKSQCHARFGTFADCGVSP